MDIISKEEAVVKGLKRFFTGVPCKHGHTSERFVHNGYCVACTNAANTVWKKKSGYDKRFRDKEGRKEKRAVTHRNWRHANPDKANRYSRSDAGKLYNSSWDCGTGKIKRLLANIRTRAKSKGLEFSLVEADIIIPEVCPVLGIALDFNSNTRTDNTPTVDRIDNSKGYTKDNICVISWRANRLKWDASVDEIKALLNYMTREDSNEK